MTLIEIVLRITGSKDVAELPTISQPLREKLTETVEKIPAARVPLEHWNTLIGAYGEEPRESKDEAREVLLRYFADTPESASANDTASDETDDAKQAMESDAVPEETDAIESIAAEEPSDTSEKKTAKPMSKQLKLFLKIWNVFTTVLVVMAVVLAVTLAGVRVFGLQVFSVLSGSMEPEYHVGSLIYVKTVDYTELAVGDDITFMLDEETVATHRIVEILPDENDPTVLRFRTQGIANDEVDGTPVHYKNVIGKPVFTIPKLGYVANYIQNPPGTYIAISIGAIILFLVFLPDLLTPEDEPKKEKKDKPKKQKQPQKPDNNEG